MASSGVHQCLSQKICHMTVWNIIGILLWNIIMEYIMEYYSALKQGNSDNATT